MKDRRGSEPDSDGSGRRDIEMGKIVRETVVQREGSDSGSGVGVVEEGTRRSCTSREELVERERERWEAR